MENGVAGPRLGGPAEESNPGVANVGGVEGARLRAAHVARVRVRGLNAGPAVQDAKQLSGENGGSNSFN
jgi:hypothetical protein